MSARIDIVNMALGMLGEKRITSIEDDSDVAKVVKDTYFIVRDATLEAHEWSFALKEFTPAKLEQDPDWAAANFFSVPSDIIRIIRVEANRAGVTLPQSTISNVGQTKSIYRRSEADWHLESGLIISDEDSIVCLGIRRVEDEGIFSPLFTIAFVAHLATYLAYALTDSDGKFNAASALYTLKIKEAVSRDGMQGSSKRIRNRSLQNVR